MTPPAKDAASGVDAPADSPDAQASDPAAPSGSAGTDARPGADTAKNAASGGKGDKGAGAGNTDPKAKDGSTPEGALRGSDEARHDPEADAADADTKPGDARSPDAAGGTPAPDARRTEIELPEFEVDAIEGDKTIFGRSGEIERRSAHPVTGIWEQFAGPNDSDFAPGGYERSVLMLNPALKTAAIYRVYRGDITLVMGGELALDTDEARARVAKGTLTVREDASSTSKFRKTPLPLGGNPAVTVAPPSGDGPWPLDWKREGMELVVGDKRYKAISREAFEQVRRGGGDIASEADKEDRIDARPPQATTQRINETSFFGLRGGGKRICFIVDVSGSMAGPKLERLKQELTGTIRSLKPGTMFSVIFFDDQAHTVSQTWLQSDADRTSALQAIASKGAGAGTDPSQAFEFAFQSLSPLPDCIYYMTDGQTNADVVGLLQRLNSARNKTTVHAIAFGDQSLEAVMQEIAARNNGAYIFVP